MVNAILAAILSFLIPGLGQAIAGDIKKGVLFFLIAIFLCIIIIYLLGGASWTYIISIIYDIYVAYDAYQMAQ